MRIAGWLAAACLFPLSVYACSEDEPKTPSARASDAGGDGAVSQKLEDAGGQQVVDTGAPDVGPLPIRCTQAELDQPCSGAGGDCTGPENTKIDIVFPTAADPAQYASHCVKVKVGTDIVLTGDFLKHPLRPKGGDTPSPIPNQTTNPPNGASGKPELVVPMATAGTRYGFECGIHGGGMFGAIQVVP
jgi:hypothetical protein